MIKKLEIICLSIIAITATCGNTFFESQLVGGMVENLQQVPSSDQERIEKFFRYLMLMDFGYTLIGDKPMSLEAYQSNVRSLNINEFFYDDQNAIIKNGWQSWDKYKHLFHLENFIFISVPNSIHSDDSFPPDRLILLINKKKCIEVIDQNILFFREALDPDLSAEGLIFKLCHQQDFFKDALKSNEAILGILLGYGIRNSEVFQRKCEIQVCLRKKINIPSALPKDWGNFEPYIREFIIHGHSSYEVPVEKQMITPDFETLTQELIYLSKNTESFRLHNSAHFIDYIQSPAFACFRNDPETEFLRENYTETRNRIRNIILEKSCLETVLLCLTNSN